MHYGELKKCDIANGEGVRVSLFVSGCRNHCKDCFQPETWDFCYGRPFTEETEREIYAELDQTRNEILMISLVIALAMGLMGMLLAGSVSRPLNELARLFKELGSGAGYAGVTGAIRFDQDRQRVDPPYDKLKFEGGKLAPR